MVGTAVPVEDEVREQARMDKDNTIQQRMIFHLFIVPPIG
jgi:hypothetical protein